MKPVAKKTPSARVDELRRVLEDANYRYYILDDPDLADIEYDRMLRELAELEAAHPELQDPNSPTVRVGVAPSGCRAASVAGGASGAVGAGACAVAAVWAGCRRPLVRRRYTLWQREAPVIAQRRCSGRTPRTCHRCRR